MEVAVLVCLFVFAMYIIVKKFKLIDKIKKLRSGENHYWYSEEQKEAMITTRNNRGDRCFKTFAIINGEKVRVTWRTKKPFHETNWDDIEYLGVGTPGGMEEIL